MPSKVLSQIYSIMIQICGYKDHTWHYIEASRTPAALMTRCMPPTTVFSGQILNSTTTVFLGRREYECSIFLDNYPFMFFFLRLPVRFSILSSWNPHVLFPRILSISFLLPFKPHPRCDTQILLLYFRHHSPHYSYHAKMRPGLENSGAIS